MVSKLAGKMEARAGKSRPTGHPPGHCFFVHFSGIFKAKVSLYDIQYSVSASIMYVTCTHNCTYSFVLVPIDALLFLG